jgi:hypothetical protein
MTLRYTGFVRSVKKSVLMISYSSSGKIISAFQFEIQISKAPFDSRPTYSMNKLLVQNGSKGFSLHRGLLRIQVAHCAMCDVAFRFILNLFGEA